MQYKNFGNFIKVKRKSLLPKVSLNKFAFDNGIEPAVLSRIENQFQGVKLETIGKIANGFGVLASELLAEYEKSQQI